MNTYGRKVNLAKGIDLINRDGVVVRHFNTPNYKTAERAYEIATAIRESAKDYSVRYWVVPETEEKEGA
jgi:hypothetical protein